MVDVRDQILKIIEDRALKQSAIAFRSGLSPDKFCAVLKKRRRLDANEFLEVCATLGMAPNEVANYKTTHSKFQQPSSETVSSA